MSTDRLTTLAERVEDDPFFLGCPLRLYAKSEGLSEAQLAAALECSPDALVLLRLCRAPTAEQGRFQKGIEEISVRFGIKPDVLTEVVRRGQAIAQLARPGTAKGTLAAARDAEAADAKPGPGGDA
jgi:hypothetical protein